jgi:hypothetical protein
MMTIEGRKIEAEADAIKKQLNASAIRLSQIQAENPPDSGMSGATEIQLHLAMGVIALAKLKYLEHK